MERQKIKKFLDSFEPFRKRTIVVVDFANVDKWSRSLGWSVGIRELARLAKSFSQGNRYLRRFYYGSDYGSDENSSKMKPWSEGVLKTAAWNGFEVVTKRVKYIRAQSNFSGYEKKCDLDVEITVDLIQERDNYDLIILFSGDGDFAYTFKYLHQNFNKRVIVFGARNHVGREIYDINKNKTVEKLCYVENFKHLLNLRHH